MMVKDLLKKLLKNSLLKEQTDFSFFWREIMLKEFMNLTEKRGKQFNQRFLTNLSPLRSTGPTQQSSCHAAKQMRKKRSKEPCFGPSLTLAMSVTSHWRRLIKVFEMDCITKNCLRPKVRFLEHFNMQKNIHNKR